MVVDARVPYWRLSGFYFFFFAILGAMMPYWGVYLRQEGFASAEIGALLAILVLTKLIGPNTLGWITDHVGQRSRLIRAASLLAFVTFPGVFLADGFWSLAAVMVVFSFFWNATLPQFEALTMNHLGRDTHRYSMIRLWGSVGFIVTVVGMGWLMDLFGHGAMPWGVMVLFLGIFLASLAAPDHDGQRRQRASGSILGVLRRPEVIALFAVCFLIQASHGPYYAFFSIYLEDNGYSKAATGGLWALGVVAEILVFLVMHRLIPRFGAFRLLLVTLLLTGLRWVLTAYFIQSVPVLLFAQTLHAFSFGVYHAVAIDLIHRFFTGPHQGRGQALYSSLSFGLGGAAGTYLSGLTWDGLGPALTFDLAAAFAFGGAVIVATMMRGVDRTPGRE